MKYLILTLAIFVCGISGCGRDPGAIGPTAANAAADATAHLAPFTFNAFTGESYRSSPQRAVKFQLPATGQPVNFLCDEEIKQDNQIHVVATLVSRAPDGWKQISLPPQLVEASWVYAAQGPADGESWAILANNLDQRDWSCALLHSADYGTTWSLWSALKDPGRENDLKSFGISSTGTAILVLHSDPPPGQHDAVDFYYLSRDHAKTWTGPQIQYDALQPAPEPDELSADKLITQLEHPATGP